MLPFFLIKPLVYGKLCNYGFKIQSWVKTDDDSVMKKLSIKSLSKKIKSISNLLTLTWWETETDLDPYLPCKLGGFPDGYKPLMKYLHCIHYSCFTGCYYILIFSHLVNMRNTYSKSFCLYLLILLLENSRRDFLLVKKKKSNKRKDVWMILH